MVKNKNRDEFSPATRRAIERQARGHCSNPTCRRLTSGATSDGTDEIRIGEAAHICAAAQGGPRYDGTMTTEERRSVENGIWLCGVCARAVDSKDSIFTVDELRDWKRRTDIDSWRSVAHNLPFGPGMQSPTPDELRDRLRAAATADLAVFRHTAKWPATAVALTLKVDKIDESLSTRALANAVVSLDDLILVAAPGMGKTTTMFQVAEGVLETGNGAPLVVLLGEWATGGDALLSSVLKRPAFAGVSEAEFRAVGTKRGVIFLLDGWNELDAAARERARIQISNLKAELPELGFVISTRKQALDTPFAGTHVDLLPLGDEQQLAIAGAMRGELGERLVDQAWRTAGVRELVTIPLYLTALLSLPEGAPFPKTKEEVLRRFVVAHEQEAGHAAALRISTHGLHQEYLNRLAVFTTTTANTSITDDNARRTVSATTQMLIADGQLTLATAQPATLLDILVSNHVLMRSGDTPGFSFQHQQFQEWYASHEVEQLMLQAVTDPAACERLKTEVLNQRPWTEAILFAVERAARGDATAQAACGAAILAAYEVDPIIAADMIYRATEEVWTPIASKVQDFVRQWHSPGRPDRAVRFMISSGRPEFDDLLWPLLTHEDEQVQAAALRAASPFRTSVLGSNAFDRVGALPHEIRKNLLHEIASNSGMDGLDLATMIAKNDNDPEVCANVVDALWFRRADRHIADLLGSAGEATFDILSAKDHLDDIADDEVQKGLEAARKRRSKTEPTTHHRLSALLYGREEEGADAEVTELIAGMPIDRKSDGDRYLLSKVRKRYPKAFADGLLRRVRENRELFNGVDNVLATAGFSLDDDALLGTALKDSQPHDELADAAASVLGPQAVGKLVDACLVARAALRDANGRYDKAASERYSALRGRIGHTPGASLVSAVEARADRISEEQIADMAELFSRDSHGASEHARPFTQDGLAVIGVLAQKWGERLLAWENATRSQKASVATLISHAPSAVLVPILKRLLDDNLLRCRGFHEAAKASGWRDLRAVREAQQSLTHEYQRAFIAIRKPETDAMMGEYLLDGDFGEPAARVLAVHWSEANEPKDDGIVAIGPNLSGVEARRAARGANPAESCPEADMIFAAVEKLIEPETTDEQKRLAVTLGIIAAGLPHGERVETINKLVDFAPRQSRASLLLSLVLSGEYIDIKLVADGIAETFEAANKETWILLRSNAFQLQDWLRLLPFAFPVSEVPAIVKAIPDAQRNPDMLEGVVSGLANSPDDGAEEVLFKLAEDDPRFYLDRRWRSAALRMGTVSSARRLIDLLMSGVLAGESRDEWYWRHEFAELISEHPKVREYVRELLKEGNLDGSLALLAHAIGESPNAGDLLLLVELEIKTGRAFVNRRSIEVAVTEHVPSKDWQGSYNVVPVPAVELRQQLLLLTGSGGANDPAARCLNGIDKTRDEYGAPETEPRHPNLASGRTWPLLTADLDAEDGG